MKISALLPGTMTLVAIFTTTMVGGSAFKETVTERVIVEVIKCLADDVIGLDGAYTDRHRILWQAGVCVRHAVYAQMPGEGWQQKLSAEDRIVSILAHARVYLREPQNVQTLYQYYKPLIVAEVRKYPGLDTRLKWYLTDLPVYFALDGLDGPLRRKPDGGVSLIKTWSDVVEDLHRAL